MPLKARRVPFSLQTSFAEMEVSSFAHDIRDMNSSRMAETDIKNTQEYQN